MLACFISYVASFESVHVLCARALLNTQVAKGNSLHLSSW